MLPYTGTTLSASNNTFKWEFSALGLFELGQTFWGVKTVYAYLLYSFCGCFWDVLYEWRLMKQVGYVFIGRIRCKKERNGTGIICQPKNLTELQTGHQWTCMSSEFSVPIYFFSFLFTGHMSQNSTEPARYACLVNRTDKNAFYTKNHKVPVLSQICDCIFRNRSWNKVCIPLFFHRKQGGLFHWALCDVMYWYANYLTTIMVIWI